jgi:hypothetical protein
MNYSERPPICFACEALEARNVQDVVLSDLLSPIKIRELAKEALVVDALCITVSSSTRFVDNIKPGNKIYSGLNFVISTTYSRVQHVRISGYVGANGDLLVPFLTLPGVKTLDLCDATGLSDRVCATIRPYLVHLHELHLNTDVALAWLPNDTDEAVGVLDDNAMTFLGLSTITGGLTALQPPSEQEDEKTMTIPMQQTTPCAIFLYRCEWLFAHQISSLFQNTTQPLVVCGVFTEDTLLEGIASTGCVPLRDFTVRGMRVQGHAIVDAHDATIRTDLIKRIDRYRQHATDEFKIQVHTPEEEKDNALTNNLLERLSQSLSMNDSPEDVMYKFELATEQPDQITVVVAAEDDEVATEADTLV